MSARPKPGDVNLAVDPPLICTNDAGEQFPRHHWILPATGSGQTESRCQRCGACRAYELPASPGYGRAWVQRGGKPDPVEIAHEGVL